MQEIPKIKGFEVALGYKSDVTKPFSWGFNYNITRLDGKVVSINGDVIPEGGAFSVGQLAPARMEVGQPYWLLLRFASRWNFPKPS